MCFVLSFSDVFLVSPVGAGIMSVPLTRVHVSYWHLVGVGERSIEKGGDWRFANGIFMAMRVHWY